jgi:hypothetical protein
VFYLSRTSKIVIAVALVLALGALAYLLLWPGHGDEPTERPLVTPADEDAAPDPVSGLVGPALQRPEQLPQADITDETCLTGVVTPIRELMERHVSGADLTAGRELNPWLGSIDAQCSPEDAAAFRASELNPWLRYEAPVAGWGDTSQDPAPSVGVPTEGGSEPVVIEVDLDELFADEEN